MRRFHTAVQDFGAYGDGCVLFVRFGNIGPYAEAPNDGLARNSPSFTTAVNDVRERFPAYASARISEADANFAEAFVAGGIACTPYEVD